MAPIRWDGTIKLRERIFNKTNGRCHLCRCQLNFENYGKSNPKDSWEVEHSVPRTKGGTDRLSNLYASCIPCNRSKGSASTRSARAKNGFKSAPLSKKRKVNNTLTCGAVGALAALFVPPPLRIAVALMGMAVGATIGHEVEPD